MIFSLICVAVSLLMFLILINTKKPAKYPPGPTFLPIVGNFLEYKKRLKVLGYHHLVWMELSEKYGEVVGLKLGRNLIVSVFGPAAIQEVFERDDFDGRPDGFFFRMRTFGKRLGLVFSDGSFWKGQRKFSIQHLRNFGFARREMEDKIHDETTSLIEKFKKCDLQPIYMHNVFGISVLNGLWAMMAGERFETDDERLKKLLKIINDCFRIVDISGGLLNQMPFLRHIAPEATGYNKLSEILERMWEFLEETITEHRKSLGLSEQPRDLIEAFLQKIELNNDPTFTDDQLMSVCLDLFMAGAETTSNTLGFAMLSMLLYPDIQKKIQKELDVEVGRNRSPNLSDKVRLKYTEAVLMEIQRRITIAPLGIAHRAVRDTELYGYNVPEDTIILTNLYSVHMDKSYWKDPLEFRPERFLDEAGNLVKHEGHYIPFGGGQKKLTFQRYPEENDPKVYFETEMGRELISRRKAWILKVRIGKPISKFMKVCSLYFKQEDYINKGKRRCLGESLGKANIFMFFTSVLHNFNVERIGEEELTLEGFDGVTMAPKPFRAKLIYREG